MKQRDNRAADVVTALLDRMRVPHWTVRSEPYAVVTIIGTPYRLLPRWVDEGADDTAADVPDLPGPDAHDISVLVGRRWSTATRHRLDEKRVSWADETGHMRIVGMPALYLARDPVREDQDASTLEVRHSSRPKWSSSSGAVAELLLTTHQRREHGEPSRMPANQLVAASVPYSTAQVSKVMQAFDDQGWTRKEGPDRGPGAGRYLIDPAGMLSSWADWVSRRRGHRVLTHATWRDPHDFFSDRLVPALKPRQWCLGGWLAADIVAPFTTTIPTLTIYLEPEQFQFGLSQIFEVSGLRPVDSGERVVFREAEPQILTLARSLHGVPIASDVRIYADLLGGGVRGRDAATHLREVQIGF